MTTSKMKYDNVHAVTTIHLFTHANGSNVGGVISGVCKMSVGLHSKQKTD